METSLFSDITYIALILILSAVSCYLYYLLRKGRSTASIPYQELMKSRAELKEALRNQDLALRSINFGLVYIDTNFRVVWETTNKIQKLVVKHQYISGQICYLTTGLEKEACVDCPFRAAVAAGKMVMRTIHVDDMDFEISATPVYDGPERELVGGLLRIEDVTKKVRFNNTLREAKERAEESDRLKSAFLANISHEIRTPLNTIIGFANMISETDDEESKQEYNTVIHNNSSMLLQLIDDTLALSKIEAGKIEFNYEWIDVNEQILGILTQFQHQHLNDDVKIEFIEKTDKCIIKTDKAGLSQMITNLISNALKFTSKGTVSIGYRINIEAEEFELYVKDTGIGIPAGKQEIIFERFTKLDPFVQGIGLGLSISKSIVSLLGGKMGVESEKGKGSCFWFRIPVEVTGN